MRQSLAARTDPCFVWPTLFGPPEFLSSRVPRVSNPGSSLRWANSPDCLFVTADESGKESCVLNFSKIIINSTSPWREQHARTGRPRLSRSVASHRFVFAPRRARPAAIDFLPRRDTFRNHYSGNAAQLLFLMSEKGAGLETTVTRRAEAYIVAQTTKRDEHRSVARLCAIAKSQKDYWWSTCVRFYYLLA